MLFGQLDQFDDSPDPDPLHECAREDYSADPHCYEHPLPGTTLRNGRCAPAPMFPVRRVIDVVGEEVRAA